jgi:hypothetical protein
VRPPEKFNQDDITHFTPLCTSIYDPNTRVLRELRRTPLDLLTLFVLDRPRECVEREPTPPIMGNIYVKIKAETGRERGVYFHPALTHDKVIRGQKSSFLSEIMTTCCVRQDRMQHGTSTVYSESVRLGGVGGVESCWRPCSAGVLHFVSDQIQNLPKC